eukprot:6482065-Amphidinium_carterae.1
MAAQLRYQVSGVRHVVVVPYEAVLALVTTKQLNTSQDKVMEYACKMGAQDCMSMFTGRHSASSNVASNLCVRSLLYGRRLMSRVQLHTFAHMLQVTIVAFKHSEAIVELFRKKFRLP